MLIEFSECNIKLLLLFIYPIFYHLGNLTKRAYMVKKNDLFNSFRQFNSYIFAGVFLIIFKIRNRRDKNSSPKENSSLNDNERKKYIKKYIINTIIEKNDRKRKIINVLFIILLCGVGIFCQFYRKLFEKKEFTNAKNSIKIFFYIIFFVLLSYFILHQKLYKHHFISLGIITVILLILFIISLHFMESIFQSFAYYFFYSLLFALYDVLKKKYMDIYFHAPYFIMLLIGLINTVVLLIYDIISYYVNPSISGIIIGFNENINSVGDVFWFILDLILICIQNLGYFLVIYYYTPCHNFVPEYIMEFYSYISDVVEGKNTFYSTTNIIIFSIGYFVNFCCIIIFNEIIILNFCGLDYNTNKRIKERELKDSENITLIEIKTFNKDEENEDN